MATILYAWELGGGLGHLLRFQPLAKRLAAEGHRVICALRELKHAEYAFSDTDVSFLPAPHLAWALPNAIEPTYTYAELLHNVGFGRVEDLRTLTRAWRSLFAQCRPDLIVCDHSPTALLAASLIETPTCNLGTGFCCPPADGALPVLRHWMPENTSVWTETERQVLMNVNEIRRACGKSAWDRLSELYASARDVFLTTFAELDHFSDRGEARYWGAWEARRGKAIQWPPGSGPRIFMYTHRFAARDWLLEHLRNQGQPTVVYSHDLPPDAFAKLAGPTISLAAEPLDIGQAATECDLAILNAGHNAVAQFLLAGKPLLLLPISLEQGLLTMRLVSQGLAASANCNQPHEIQAAMSRLLADGRAPDAARAFAAKYSSYNSDSAQDGIVARLEGMLRSA